jgi:hypothetical protein
MDQMSPIIAQARIGRGCRLTTWTEDTLLRQVVYEGLREDEPAAEVCRAVPHPKRNA